MSAVRFGLTVDSNNGHHVHFRVFAATGGQHLGGCGQLVMTDTEFAAFRELLGPRLTDRPDPVGACADEWQPYHEAGTRPDHCGTCSERSVPAQ